MSLDLSPPPALIAQAPAAPSASHRGIPMRVSAIGHMIVTGQVRGRTVEVLVDSGATATIVDRSWAVAAGLPLRTVKGQGFGAGGANLALAELDGVTLSVGGMVLGGLGLVAIDLGNVGAGLARNRAAPFQVILGADALRRWRAVIDFRTSTLWLAPPPVRRG